jgi:3-hydroxyisobutyrate dehydrogenase-like beta-hydroxyacid dehydrogenase
VAGTLAIMASGAETDLLKIELAIRHVHAYGSGQVTKTVNQISLLSA